MSHYRSTIDQLKTAGISGVDAFSDRLRDNEKDPGTLDDLLFEARAALMFRRHQFSVELSDRPDLKLALSDKSLFAEVKHFRVKEQDRVDHVRMHASRGELVSFGDTLTAKEGVAAWEQVADVAERKAAVYVHGLPNVLLIGSSSPGCIDDAIMPTSINVIAERSARHPQSGLGKLNGIMLISSDFNLGESRNVYYFPTRTPAVALGPELEAALDGITKG